MFYLTQAARPHLTKGAAIINCTSVTMYQGSAGAARLFATKGAITAFTRSLSENLVERRHPRERRRAGPDLDAAQPVRRRDTGEDEAFRRETPMGRPGQPNEVAPAFLFLACEDCSYMSGQVLHPNGGTIVNG